MALDHTIFVGILKTFLEGLPCLSAGKAIIMLAYYLCACHKVKVRCAVAELGHVTMLCFSDVIDGDVKSVGNRRSQNIVVWNRVGGQRGILWRWSWRGK